MVCGPVSAEVVSLDADAMIKEGKELAKIHQNIVVKVPLIPEGLKATKQMAAEGIKVLRDAVLLDDTSVAGGESRCLVRLSVYRPVR